jgi:hypothetical protein
MRITGQGYLGINTTTPKFYLDVNGASRIAGANGLYFGGTATSASDYSHLIYNSSGNLIIQPRVDATSAITFQNAAGSTNLLTINSTNNSIELGGWLKRTKGANVSSASSITPTGYIFHLTGTSVVSTIVVPYTGWTGEITIIADGVSGVTTGGNINNILTFTSGLAYHFVWDGSTWYLVY